MKRILKVAPLLLLALVLAFSPLLMAAPVSAAGDSQYIYGGYVYPEVPVSLADFPYSCIFFNVDTVALFCTDSSVVYDSSLSAFVAPSGCSVFIYVLADASWVFLESEEIPVGGVVALCDSLIFHWSSFDFVGPGGIPFVASDPVPYSPSTGDLPYDPAPELPSSGNGIFYQAYDLFSQYIYGVESSELTSDQMMTLTVLATLAALFLVSLPFILVIGFIKLFR